MQNVWAILLTSLGAAVVILGPQLANEVFEFIQKTSEKINAWNPLVKRAVIAFATVLFVQAIDLLGVVLNWTDLTAVTSQEWANLIAILLGQLFRTQDKIREATKE